MEIVDTHVHYWRDLGGSAGREMGEPVSYTAVLDAMTSAGVDHVLCVTPRLMGFDNSYSLEGARLHPPRFRVLARFDHQTPDVIGALRNLMSAPYVLGLRVSFMQPGTWADDQEVNGLWSAAEQLGTPIALYAPHQPRQVNELIGRHPKLRLIVDHMTLRHSDPATAFEHWSDVLALAKWPHIAVKVSGLIDAVREPYPFPTAQRYLKEVCETFGSERVMWGSNYPPVLKFCTYKESVEFVRVASDFLSPQDRENVLGGSANRFFGLSWKSDRP